MRRSGAVRRLNVAGEGGEYETLVVYAPFFRARLDLEVVRSVVTPTTAQLVVDGAKLKSKET